MMLAIPETKASGLAAANMMVSAESDNASGIVSLPQK
jgi:hypothetical protein